MFGLQRTLFRTGFRLRLLAVLRMDMYGGIGINVGLHSHLGGFEYRALERIGIFVEDQRERHLQSGDAYIVLEHTCLDEVHAVTRVTDMLQRFNDLLGIHSCDRRNGNCLSLSQSWVLPIGSAVPIARRYI